MILQNWSLNMPESYGKEEIKHSFRHSNPSEFTPIGRVEK